MTHTVLNSLHSNKGNKKMIGAIAGDIIGSVYEAQPTKKKDFPLFLSVGANLGC